MYKLQHSMNIARAKGKEARLIQQIEDDFHRLSFAGASVVARRYASLFTNFAYVHAYPEGGQPADVSGRIHVSPSGRHAHLIYILVDRGNADYVGLPLAHDNMLRRLFEMYTSSRLHHLGIDITPGRVTMENSSA